MKLERGSIKKIAFGALGVLSMLLGLFLVPTLFYNACGLAGSADCADGPKWVNLVVILVLTIFIAGTFFLATRLFRSASSKNSI